MLKLNTDENRELSFEINIKGINHKDLTGSLKFIVEGVSYGFPVKILEDYISVSVPPLDDIIKSSLKDGSIVECKLDIFGNGFYLNPWQSQFKLKTPVRMEAKLFADDAVPDKLLSEKKEPEKTITATLKEETVEVDYNSKECDDNDDKTKVTEIHETDNSSTKQLIEMLMSKLSKKPITKEQVNRVEKKLKKQVIKKESVTSKKTNKKKIVQELVNSKLSKMSNLIDNILSGKRVSKKVIKESKKTHSKKTSIKASRHKILSSSKSSDPVINLMESFGFRNPKSQKKLIERAKDIGGDDQDAVLATISKLLGPAERPETSFEQYAKKVYDQEND